MKQSVLTNKCLFISPETLQRGRPDLLKHLQRSRKTHAGGDDEIAPTAKKPKLILCNDTVSHGEEAVMGKFSDLAKRTTESELAIKNLQQENATLTFALQKIQQQDEIKTRQLLQLEEQIRVMDLQMTQAFQQLQAQLSQSNQPLPFNRETSLSAVSPSDLLRYLNMNPALQREFTLNPSLQRELSLNPGLQRELSLNFDLQRLATPNFGTFSPAPGAFGGTAAAAAENIVQQQAHDLAANATGGGGGPTIPRHPRMKGSDSLSTSIGDSAAVATVEAAMPMLRRRPNMKTGDSAPTAPIAMPTLPRHPRMKGSEDPSGANDGAVAPLDIAAALKERILTDNGTTRGTSPVPQSSLLGRPGGSPVPPSSMLGRAGSSHVSPASLLPNGFGGNSALAGHFLAGRVGHSVVANEITNSTRTSPLPGNNAPAPQQRGLLGSVRQGGNILDGSLSTIGGGEGNAVTVEESSGISSLMELARGPTPM